MPDTNPDAVKLLSDDALREIDELQVARKRLLKQGKEFHLETAVWNIDTLCATVRALQAADNHHYQLWLDLKERHQHKFAAVDGKWSDTCQQCGVTTGDDHDGYDCIAWLRRCRDELQSQLAQVTQERDEYRERLLKATETEVEI